MIDHVLSGAVVMHADGILFAGANRAGKTIVIRALSDMLPRGRALTWRNRCMCMIYRRNINNCRDH